MLFDHISFSVGDSLNSIYDVPDLVEIYTGFGLPFNQSFIGGDKYFTMTGTVESFIVNHCKEKLKNLDVSATDIDAIFFISSDLSDFQVDDALYKRILNALGMRKAVPFGFTLHECVSTLAALDWSIYLLQKKRFDTIFIVSFDIFKQRITSYGLCSDVISSFLVSNQIKSGFEVLSYSNKYSFSGLIGEQDIKQRVSLAKESLSDALNPLGLKVKDVEKIFSTNFYSGLMKFNRMMMGIPEDIFYSETMQLYGHCGNSDAFINLSHYLHQKPRTSAYFILQSYAAGYCTHMLIKKIG